MDDQPEQARRYATTMVAMYAPVFAPTMGARLWPIRMPPFHKLPPSIQMRISQHQQQLREMAIIEREGRP